MEPVHYTYNIPALSTRHRKILGSIIRTPKLPLPKVADFLGSATKKITQRRLPRPMIILNRRNMVSGGYKTPIYPIRDITPRKIYRETSDYPLEISKSCNNIFQNNPDIRNSIHRQQRYSAWIIQRSILYWIGRSKIHSRCLNMLFGAPILCKSKKQPTVARRTCEAEYVASYHTAQDITWLLQLATDILWQQAHEDLTKILPPIPLNINNQSAIKVLSNERKITKKTDIHQRTSSDSACKWVSNYAQTYRWRQEPDRRGNKIPMQFYIRKHKTANVWSKPPFPQLYERTRDWLQVLKHILLSHTTSQADRSYV